MITAPALVGFNPVETLSLNKNRIRADLESLVASCLALDNQNLNHKYSVLQQCQSKQLELIVSHPLFRVAVNDLVQGIQTTSKETISDGINTFQWLLAGIEGISKIDSWLPLNSNFSATIPSAGVVFQFSSDVKEFHIKGTLDDILLTVDGNTHNVKFNEIDYFAAIPLNNEQWLTMWSLYSNGFVIDPISPGYRSCLPEGWFTQSLSPKFFNGWNETIKKTLDLLRLCGLEHILEEIKILTQVIVPVRNPNDSSHLSSSYPALPGVVCMSWTKNILQFLEALIHEAGHHKLFLVERYDQLVMSSDPIYASPWRSDPRPPRGLIHGAYAFAGVFRLWTALLDSNCLPEKYIKPLIEARQKTGKQVQEALTELQKARVLTPLGAELAGYLEKVVLEKSKSRFIDSSSTTIEDSVSLSSDEQILDSQLLLDEVCNQHPWAETLFGRTKTALENALTRAQIDSSLISLTEKVISVYYLRWCLPLAEASKLAPDSNDSAKWMSIHIQCGLIWRYLDQAADGHASDAREKFLYEDAAVAILITILEDMRKLGAQMSYRIRRLLFQFHVYKMVEDSGTVNHQDIWRRASSFLVVPHFLLLPFPKYRRAFKEYTNLVGLLDDLEDAWDDLAQGRRTWVSNMLITKPVLSCKPEFQEVCNRYTQKLLFLIPQEFPVWRQLVLDASRRCIKAISDLE